MSSFVQPLMTACLFCPCTFCNLPFYGSVCCHLPNFCPSLDLLTASVPRVCPIHAPVKHPKGICAPDLLCLSSYTAIHQSAQDRNFAVALGAPSSPSPSAGKELRPVMLLLSLDSVALSLCSSCISAIISSLGFLLPVLHLFHPFSVPSHLSNRPEPFWASASFCT